MGCYLRSIILKPLIELLMIIYCVSLKTEKREKGLGPDFLQCTDVRYKKLCELLWMALWLLFFYVDFGNRQGCPFSPLAFVLAIDLLAIKIRHLQNIKGIRNWSLNNVSYIEDTIKTDFYADDTALFLNDDDDRRYALNVIHEFSIFYGLEVNKTVTRHYMDSLFFLFLMFFFWFLFNIIRKSCHLRF